MLYNTCLKKELKNGSLCRFYTDDHVRRGGLICRELWNNELNMLYSSVPHLHFFFKYSCNIRLMYYYLMAKPRSVQTFSRDSPLSPQMQQLQLKSAGRIFIRALLVFLKSLLLGDSWLFRAISHLITCQTTTASISLQHQQNLSVRADRFYPATTPSNKYLPHCQLFK